MAATGALAQREPPKVQMRTAPTPDAVPLAPVVVEGTTPAALKQQTFDFVQSYAAATPKLDRLARWDEQICVSVQGLAPAESAQVQSRVEEVAKALRLKVRGAGCNPNVEIMFADQPQPFLDRVAAQRPDLLGYGYRHDADTLKRVTLPIQAWYVTATAGGAANTGGTNFAFVDRTDTTSNQARQTNGMVIDDPDSLPPSGCAESRLSNCLKSVFQHVLVVVDRDAVRAYESGPVIDYVTMLALSEPRALGSCNVLPSVTDLFACRRGDEPVKGLTRADVAYLEALYRTQLDARKTTQLADMSSRMADMLLKDNASARVKAPR
jgi:hypothetical protein